MIAGTAAIVFVLALLFITAVELISGKPLSAIFGGPDSGTTFRNIVSPPPPPASTTTTSTVPATSTTTSTHDESSTSTTSDHDRAEGDLDDRRHHLQHHHDHDHHGSGARRNDDDRVGRYQPLNSAGRRSTKLAMPSCESSVWVTISWPIASS